MYVLGVSEHFTWESCIVIQHPSDMLNF